MVESDSGWTSLELMIDYFLFDPRCAGGQFSGAWAFSSSLGFWSSELNPDLLHFSGWEIRSRYRERNVQVLHMGKSQKTQIWGRHEALGLHLNDGAGESGWVKRERERESNGVQMTVGVKRKDSLGLLFHDQLLGHGLPTGGHTWVRSHLPLCPSCINSHPLSPPLQIFLAYTVQGSSFVFGDTLVQSVFAFQVIPILWAGMTMSVKGQGDKSEDEAHVQETR